MHFEIDRSSSLVKIWNIAYGNCIGKAVTGCEHKQDIREAAYPVFEKGCNQTRIDILILEIK